MVVGVLNPERAREVLVEYVEDIDEYAYACPTYIEETGRSACWLSMGPADYWDGSVDHTGEPLPR